jgi:hypothetical protein
MGNVRLGMGNTPNHHFNAPVGRWRDERFATIRRQFGAITWMRRFLTPTQGERNSPETMVATLHSSDTSIIIDLILLADAVGAKDTPDTRRLAQAVSRTARVSGASTIALRARVVERLASVAAPQAQIVLAVNRLLVASERQIHLLPSQGAAWEHPIALDALCPRDHRP